MGGLFPQPLRVAERLVARLPGLFACLLRLVACLPRLVAYLASLRPRGLLGLPGLFARRVVRLLAGLPLGAAHLPRGRG